MYLLDLEPASPALAAYPQHPLAGRESHLPLEDLEAFGHPPDIRWLGGCVRVHQQMRISFKDAEKFRTADRIQGHVGRLELYGRAGGRGPVVRSGRLLCSSDHFTIRHYHACGLRPVWAPSIYAFSP